jgi:translation initiation factor 2 alpha subunit (eIF-2alpha)
MVEEVLTIVAEDLKQEQDEAFMEYLSNLLGVNVKYMDSYQVIEKLSENGISVILAVGGGEDMKMRAEFWKGEDLIGSLDMSNMGE